MVYQTALDSPPRYQFESNSGTLYASQTNNCGPTCITKIACYFKDTYYWIETTRRLGAPCCIPTTPGQQRLMLEKRGVPVDIVWIDTLSELSTLVGWGTKPIVIGVYMGRVPALVRDHDFYGWHALTVLSKATLMDGTKGFWVNDPNFSPPGGYRPDPDDGVKFYSEQVMQYALIQNTPRWAIVPRYPKQIELPVEEGLPVRFRSPDPSWVKIKGNIDIKNAPRFGAGTIVTTGPNGAGEYPLVGWTEGEAYKIGSGKTSKSWGFYRIYDDPNDRMVGRFAYFPATTAIVRKA